MATLRTDSVVKGFSGAFGDSIVFKQVNGKTIMTARARKPSKQSETQRQNRNKFRQATYYASVVLLDAEKKAYYTRKAKKLKLPNAYTAAITDYMRHSDISDLDTKKFTRKAGGEINVRVKRKDFAPTEVTFTLLDNNGCTLEAGTAIRKDDRYYFKSTLAVNEAIPITIRVTEGIYAAKRYRDFIV